MIEVEWRRHHADHLREKAKEDAIVIMCNKELWTLPRR
jgi:hypothetical protein